jgi:hypothetical protein
LPAVPLLPAAPVRMPPDPPQLALKITAAKAAGTVTTAETPRMRDQVFFISVIPFSRLFGPSIPDSRRPDN